MRAVLWSAAVAGLLAVGMILVPGISSAHSSSSAGLDPELSPQVHHITLTSPNAQTDGSFGWSVAVSGTTVVVGAIGETASGYDSAGHSYVF